MKVQLVPAGEATEATHADARYDHDSNKDQAEKNLYSHSLPQPLAQQNAADDPSHDATEKSDHWREIALRETKQHKR